MQHVSREELRRVMATVEQLTGQGVASAKVRPDLRQLRLELADGRLVMVGIDTDEDGRPRLSIDIVRAAERSAPQLEVRFDG